MKTSKRFLALLLVLICVLSLCFASSAAGEPSLNWTRIQTSASGLKKGDYYLDFSRYFAAGDAAALSAGTWYIDVDTMQLKATNLSARYESFVANATSGFIISNCLDQVGIQWLPVAKSKANVQPGGWYFDKDAAFEAMTVYYLDQQNVPSDERPAALTELQEYLDDFLAHYNIAVNPGDKLLRYQLTRTDGEGGVYALMRLPVFLATNPGSYEETGHAIVLEAAVQQMNVQEPQPQSKTGIAKLIENFYAFFKPFFDFFRRLFGIK